MQFLEGETLAQRISRGAMAIKDALDVGIQVAEALAAARTDGQSVVTQINQMTTPEAWSRNTETWYRQSLRALNLHS